MTPDSTEQLLAAFLCPGCGFAISRQRLRDRGIHHCACGERFVPNADQTALTYVDEMPHEEYLGG